MVWTSSSRVSLRTVELLIMMVEKSDAANVQECGSPRAEAAPCSTYTSRLCALSLDLVQPHLHICF